MERSQKYGYVYIVYCSLAISFALFLYLQYLKLDYSPDDTYIYLQYSKNLAEGNNFSFNPGEPSYGITSPAWAAILTIPYLTGLDGFWFAKFLDLFFIIVSFILFFKLTSVFAKENYLIRGFIASMFMLNPWIIRSTFTGMETSFAVLIVLLIFILYYKRKFLIMFFLLGISVLLRPECLILMIIIFICVAFLHYKEKKLRISLLLKYIVCASIVIIPFWIFAYLTFGTIVSNTSTGKAALTYDISILLAQAEFILKIVVLSAPLEVLLGICGLTFIIYKRDNPDYLPVVLWVLCLLALYIITTAAVMVRYLLILYPFVLLMAVRFLQHITFKPKLVISICLIAVLIYSHFSFYNYVKPYCDGFTNGVRECLIPIGEWLDNNTTPQSRILVNDVGAIGYYSDRYIIDAAALINRDLNLNKKILSVPLIEKEYPHFMLNFIDADYLIEKDTVKAQHMEMIYNKRLEPCASFVFQQMWVFNPNPQYFTIYKISQP